MSGESVRAAAEAAERAAIKRRYPASFTELTDQSYRVRIMPTDPDMPVGLPGGITVTVTLPDDYPAAKAVLEASAEALPAAVLAQVNKAISRFVAATDWGTGPMARAAVRWVENHFGDVLRAVIELQSEQAAKEAAEAAAAAAATASAAAASLAAAAKATAAASQTAAAASAEIPASAAVGPEPAVDAPAVAVDPVSAAFAAQHAWTVEEHRAFEAAVRDMLHERRRSVTDSSVWRTVAQRVSAVAAMAYPPPETTVRTAAECAARFIMLRRIAQEWLHTCVKRDAAAVPVVKPAVPVAKPAVLAASTASTAASASTPAAVTASAAKRADGAKPARNTGVRWTKGEERFFYGEEEVEAEDTAVAMATAATAAAGGAGGKARSSGSEDEGDTADEDEEDDDSYYSDDDAEEETSEEEEEEERREHGIETTSRAVAFANVHLAPAHRGYQLMLERLNLENIGALAATRAVLNLQCSRCNTLVSANVEGAKLRKEGEAAAAEPASSPAAPSDGGVPFHKGSEYKAWCPKCSLLLSAYFRPTLIHEGSSSMGYVDCTQCVVASLQQASLVATCLDCGTPAELPRLAPPTTWELACHTCYVHMFCDVRAVSVTLATGDNAAAVAGAGAGKRGGKGNRFTPGRPLPDTGVCKHYKHSHRYLRFPCCDMAYACDVCHDEAEDHPHEYARRMICGYCSREQLFSNNPCISCGSYLTRQRRTTTHWEGGKGQRNRRFMSRKDDKKWVNSKLKTRSRKSERVGPQGSKKPAAKTFERYHGATVETVVVKPKGPGRES